MAARARVQLGITGQSLVLEVIEAGRPSSAPTLTIRDPADDPDATVGATGTLPHAGTSSLENVDTTTTATCGDGQTDPTLIPIAAAGSGPVVGQAYLIRGTLGQREWVVPKRVNGTSIYATRALAFSYATGSTFQSTRATYALPSSLLSAPGVFADESYLRTGYWADWRCTVGGVAQRLVTEFDLVRRRWTSGVTGLDLEVETPGLIDQEPSEQAGQAWAPQIARAEEIFELDLLARGIRVDLLRGAEWTRPYVRAQARVVIGSAGRAPHNLDPVVERDYWERKYEQLMARLQAGGVPSGYDADESGSLSEGEEDGEHSSLWLVR